MTDAVKTALDAVHASLNDNNEGLDEKIAEVKRSKESAIDDQDFERAARLRAKGQEVLSRHLRAEVGQERSVLVEGGMSGRTEYFTEVHFAEEKPEGTILRLRIAGEDGARLLA